MLYGPAKTKKTWWAGAAAEAGFNVLFFEGDGNFGILKNLSQEAQERVYVVPARDRLNKAVFAELMAVFLETKTLIWDEKEQVARQKITKDLRDQCIFIDKADLDTNWVIVVDSYTALCASISLQYCLENAIALSDAKKTDWDGYAWAGRLATFMIQQLKNIFDCHVIVIGHSDVYEKKKTVGDKQVTDWTRMLPKSTSGPHALTLAKNFTDIFLFSIVGTTFYIDTRADKDRDGGTINIKPDRYKWDDLQFADVIKQAGLSLPPADLPLPDFSITDEIFEKLQPVKRGGKLPGKSQPINPSSKPAKIGVNVAKPNSESTVRKIKLPTTNQKV